jgi:hypothetical protein
MGSVSNRNKVVHDGNEQCYANIQAFLIMGKYFFLWAGRHSGQARLALEPKRHWMEPAG